MRNRTAKRGREIVVAKLTAVGRAAALAGILAATTLVSAQTERRLPEATAQAVPTTLSRHAAGVRLLTPEQMSAADRALADWAREPIRAAADWAAIDFGAGPWSQRQIDCPAFANHLFLLFESGDGAGARSRFSVALGREGAHALHLIPIERHGYALFTTAAENRRTINLFNRIRAEERAGRPASERAEGLDWMGMGSCYAALAGAAVPVDGGQLTPPATLTLRQDGGAELSFGGSGTAAAEAWQLSFDGQGQLSKVSLRPAALPAVKIGRPAAATPRPRRLLPQSIEGSGRVLRPAAVDESGRKIK